MRAHKVPKIDPDKLASKAELEALLREKENASSQQTSYGDYEESLIAKELETHPHITREEAIADLKTAGRL